MPLPVSNLFMPPLMPFIHMPPLIWNLFIMPLHQWKLFMTATLCLLFMLPLIWNLFIMPLPAWKLLMYVTPPWYECTKLLLSVAATATFMMVALSWLNFISRDGKNLIWEWGAKGRCKYTFSPPAFWSELPTLSVKWTGKSPAPRFFGKKC